MPGESSKTRPAICTTSRCIEGFQQRRQKCGLTRRKPAHESRPTRSSSWSGKPSECCGEDSRQSNNPFGNLFTKTRRSRGKVGLPHSRSWSPTKYDSMPATRTWGPGCHTRSRSLDDEPSSSSELNVLSSTQSSPTQDIGHGNDEHETNIGVPSLNIVTAAGHATDDTIGSQESRVEQRNKSATKVNRIRFAEDLATPMRESPGTLLRQPEDTEVRLQQILGEDAGTTYIDIRAMTKSVQMIGVFVVGLYGVFALLLSVLGAGIIRYTPKWFHSQDYTRKDRTLRRRSTSSPRASPSSVRNGSKPSVASILVDEKVFPEAEIATEVEDQVESLPSLSPASSNPFNEMDGGYGQDGHATDSSSFTSTPDQELARTLSFNVQKRHGQDDLSLQQEPWRHAVLPLHDKASHISTGTPRPKSSAKSTRSVMHPWRKRP